jgi:hypothetical protein
MPGGDRPLRVLFGFLERAGTPGFVFMRPAKWQRIDRVMRLSKPPPNRRLGTRI